MCGTLKETASSFSGQLPDFELLMEAVKPMFLFISHVISLNVFLIMCWGISLVHVYFSACWTFTVVRVTM